MINLATLTKSLPYCSHLYTTHNIYIIIKMRKKLLCWYSTVTKADHASFVNGRKNKNISSQCDPVTKGTLTS